MGQEQSGSCGPKSTLACPMPGNPFHQPALRIHQESKTGLRHSRGDINRGEKPRRRGRTRVNAVEGLDWQPLCRGYSRDPECGHVTSRQKRPPNVTRSPLVCRTPVKVQHTSYGYALGFAERVAFVPARRTATRAALSGTVSARAASARSRTRSISASVYGPFTPEIAASFMPCFRPNL